ncbi:MAG TPA: hypothetical protein VHF25_14770 [Nitriliruptorales bacterium]|nr:hypothetical protein [Nitriliruptorales bacterium]
MSDKILERVNAQACLPQDGTHGASRDLTMVGDDDHTPVWVAHLDVASSARHFLEAGTSKCGKDLATGVEPQ